ncbi:MAG: DUF5060 domain-containing protein [Opitutales bacterium]
MKTFVAATVLLGLTALPTHAAVTGATLNANNGQIQSVTANGYTTQVASLVTGTSTGAVLDNAFPITQADNFNVFSYFARNGTAPGWTIDLGAWSDANGDNPDFFLYEYGANDSLTVAPILPGNVVGQAINISASTWTTIGITAPGGSNNGQSLAGIAWSITDLLDASGLALDNSTEITGIQIESATIDAASFMAAVVEGTGGGPPPVDFGPSAALDTSTDGVFGDLKQWHRVTVAFAGPDTSEDASVNPFTDYRLNVTFTHTETGKTYQIPGYYAADGHAGETGATAGNIWRAHLSPDFTGEWTYLASFRTGSNIAVDDNPDAGTATAFDGASGAFMIAPTDKAAPDFRGRGRLEYVGQRYLRFAGTGEYFVKAGADSPENFLANPDIDGTSNHGGANFLRTWTPHLGDWNTGDPHWKNGLGRGHIGALNYLASEGQNVFSFLTYNSGGDGKDVWPFIAHDNPLRYDCSKLDQWAIVMRHAQSLGIYLHFKTQEQEMDNDPPFALDGGNVGLERKLYYRELIARFGHNLALNWNLGEENTQNNTQRRDMAQYFFDNDPYGHNVVIHTFPGQTDSVYGALVGAQSKLTGASIQKGWEQVHRTSLKWVEESVAENRPWIVANDEIGPAQRGVPPDTGYSGFNGSGTPTQADVRQAVLWGNLMAGGAGVEYYFGYSLPEDDLDCDDWRSRDRMWDYNRHALNFFNTWLPFWEMSSDNSLVGNASDANTNYCFAKPGEIYAIYLSDGGTVSLDLESSTATYQVRWYDPRDGGPLQEGTVTEITGPGLQSIGQAPSATSSDWAVLVSLEAMLPNTPPTLTSATFRVIEGSAVGTGVGSLPAADSDPGQQLTFAITSGNESGTFSIDAATGLIEVADPTDLIKLNNPFFRLGITATDNGLPPEEATADATIILEHTVVGKRILFIRGGEDTGGFLEGGSDEQLADISNELTFNGNHGWGSLRDTLLAEGYLIEQRIEGPLSNNTPIDLAGIDLSIYDVIVFGSNNADYTPDGSSDLVDALEAWVRSGGGALFISDANFGTNWGDAPDSDQDFLDRFGLTVYQDQGTYSIFENEFLAPEHPIFKGFPDTSADDVTRFDGEGVSPFTFNPVPIPGARITLLAPAKGNVRVNDAFGQGTSRPSTANDASVVAVEIGVGRVVGHFDRNTFFNLNGAGTNIFRFSNQQYARNLFRWLSGGGQVALDNWAEENFSSDFGVPALEDSVWGLLANPDHDPYVNLLEYFLKLDPNSPEFGRVAFTVESGLGVVSFPQADFAPGAAGQVEWTENFTDWFTESVTLETSEDLGDATVMRAMLPEPATGNIFGRLRVNYETAE